MEISLPIAAYIAVSTFVTVSTFYGGVIHRPPEKLFTISEQTLLLFVCVLVGLVWVLFVPVLAVIASKYVAIVVDEWRRDLLHARAAKARG